MLNNSMIWHSLKSHAQGIKDTPFEKFFDTDKDRLKHFSIETDGLYFDYSKSALDAHGKALLVEAAKQADLEGWRAKMFAGEAINNTEDRTVWHVALRSKKPPKVVSETLEKMKSFTEQVHSGAVKGHSGKAFESVINIGIGGSDLGPHMVYEALKSGADQQRVPKVHYVANVDAEDLLSALSQCDPETTLILVASKTFTTIETLTNAQTAKEWLLKHFDGDQTAVASHFAALSTNAEAVEAFGIDVARMFPFEDWVGGRFSVWSAIGLSLCLGLGFKAFQDFLDGAEAMDLHFLNAPLDQNLPVMAGLLGYWYRTFLDYLAYAALPYDQRLSLFPLWLQQLDMESNGKAVSRQGNALSWQTGPIVFGQPGTNGQHAFYQHIHQSETVTPCEFIGVLKADHSYQNHQDILLANMIAQAQALMEGQKAPEGQPWRGFSGNRPSTCLLLPALNAYTLGQLLALYEHKIFVQGVLWDINSFDQWGVELGKVLAKNILGDKTKSAKLDPSTAELVKRAKL